MKIPVYLPPKFVELFLHPLPESTVVHTRAAEITLSGISFGPSSRRARVTVLCRPT